MPHMLNAAPGLEPDRAAEIERASLFRDMPVSHDVIFHSPLGFAGLGTPVYDPRLDIFSGALESPTDPFVTLPVPGALGIFPAAIRQARLPRVSTGPAGPHPAWSSGLSPGREHDKALDLRLPFGRIAPGPGMA